MPFKPYTRMCIESGTCLGRALAGAPGVWRGAVLEAAVGAGWLLVAVAGFAGLVEGGRRNGSIEFGS